MTTTFSTVPAGVAVDGAHVYWVESSSDTPSIGRANLDGSGVDENFIPIPIGNYRSMRGWRSTPRTSIGAIQYGNLDLNRGGDPERHSGSIRTSSPTRMPLASRAVWQSTARTSTGASGGGFGSPDGEIGRANLDGTGVDDFFIPLPTVPSNLNSPCGVAVDGAHVYWVERLYNFGVPPIPDSSIGRANLDGRRRGPRISFPPSLRQLLSVRGGGRWRLRLLGRPAAIGRAKLDGSGGGPGLHP